MHHACRLLILVSESKGITTVPRSRPPGRKILYASRTRVLILSADCTVTILSEYISTASAFSSCVGIGAFANARSQAGASAAVARGALLSAQMDRSRKQKVLRTRSVASGRRSPWLHNDLFVIAGPYCLKKSSQIRIKFDVKHQQIAAQHARQVQGAPVVFYLTNVCRRLGI